MSAKDSSAPSRSEAPAEEEASTAIAEPAPATPAAQAPTDMAKMMLERGDGNAFADVLAGGAVSGVGVAAAEGTIGLGNIGTIGYGAGGGGLAESRAPSLRSWFPETFLFEPLIETDAQGNATHSVRVPDRLTTWRVLALAHSRAGTQAGAETSFLGTLPSYVEPVVPDFLSVGDEALIPVQVVNTTDTPTTGELSVNVEGAAMNRTASTVQLAAGASQVVYVTVAPKRPGTLAFEASLGGADLVRRTVAVNPLGRPVSATRSGTLAAPRNFELELPGKLERLSTELRLKLFPGATALLRSELAGVSGRNAAGATGAHDAPLEGEHDIARTSITVPIPVPAPELGDAYSLLLAARGRPLLDKLPKEAQPAAREQLRKLTLVAAQRVVRAARAPDVLTAAMLAEAALAHPDNPVLTRLGERLVAQVEQAQRPDGTFGGGDGTPLQQVLISTAECVRAVAAATATPSDRQRAARVSAKASAAFARHLKRIDDGYTAAHVLASGAVTGADAELLRQLVRESVKPDGDGVHSFALPSRTRRSDGASPSSVEASALAVLALRDDPDASALVSDLGARILASYDPLVGFGDGRTNVAALEAVLALFSGALPDPITVRVLQDGKLLTEQRFTREQLTDPQSLTVPIEQADGKHRYDVVADPSVPGLGFHLALHGYAEWSAEPNISGLELSIEPAGPARVGQPLEVVVQATAPAGHPVQIVHRLPAGVQVDEPSLTALRNDATLMSFETQDGQVTLSFAPSVSGKALSARYRVIPTLAGKLNAPASSVAAASTTLHVPPARWVVAR